MGKFMKGCAITALILIVLGAVMAVTAGALKGTAEIGQVVESVTGGRIHFNPYGWGVFINDNDWDGFYHIEDNTIFDAAYDILRGNVEKSVAGDNINSLDIEVGGCQFEFQPSGDSNFYVEAKNTGKFQCYEKGNTLYIKSTRSINRWQDWKNCEIILYVPEDYFYDKVEIELGAGLLVIGDLMADKADLTVGAGQITVEYLQADTCSIEVGMGEADVNDMQINEADVEVGMGRLYMYGSILKELNAECSMGSIEMDLEGSEEDFNYGLEAAMGNVTIGHNDYSGIAIEKNKKNHTHHAQKDMDIECAMGDNEVSFN